MSGHSLQWPSCSSSLGCSAILWPHNYCVERTDTHRQHTTAVSEHWHYAYSRPQRVSYQRELLNAESFSVKLLVLSVCATRGLCYWISIVDASVGGASAENNGGGQTQKEMNLNTQDPSQEQKRHRGWGWQFPCFCQKQMSTWSPATQPSRIKPIEMLPFTSI